jgi:hypothetical protein
MKRQTQDQAKQAKRTKIAVRTRGCRTCGAASIFHGGQPNPNCPDCGGMGRNR